MMPRALFAWLVHLYTAAGLVAAALMAVLIVRGGDDAFRWVFALMVVTSAIDATDGVMARRANVKQVLPRFDGATLDNLTDFHTYTSLPLLLLWRAKILNGGLAWLLVLPLLASAYGYSQRDAKTPDGFFLGFPSCWNAVAFYLYFLHPPGWSSASMIVLFSVLTFIPSRYLYASRGGPFATFVAIGGAVWALLVVVVLLRPASERETLTMISLTYPLAYLTLSWWVSWTGDRS
jgi:phosphatidylcholine synthase